MTAAAESRICGPLASGKPQFRTFLRVRAPIGAARRIPAMHRIRFALLITACAIAAVPAAGAELEARSTIDSVIVYPDGAAVTRIIRADLPGGDSVLLARDFPPGLDPASL